MSNTEGASIVTEGASIATESASIATTGAGAGIAAHLANTDALLALVSALSASGHLNPDIFKEHLEKVREVQSGSPVFNEHYYEKGLKNFIWAAEGLLKDR